MAKTKIQAPIGARGLPFVVVRDDVDVPPIQKAMKWKHKDKATRKVHACTRKKPKAHGHHLKGFLHLGPTFKRTHLA